nr:972_t:CDS:2 [Entrophospora candida]
MAAHEEKIKQGVERASNKLDEAKKNLEEFMKEENLMKFKRILGMGSLMKEKEKLEAAVKKWRDQVIKPQDKLVEFKGEKA